MTNDQQQVEVWRKEHKDLLLATNNWCLANFQEADGSYYDWHLQASWEGFLMAKRSMPPIELPQEDFLVGSAGQVDAIYFCNQIKDSITEAGYSYKVKN